MIAINHSGGGRGQGALHARQLIRGEAVGLQIGEAPVGIPEVRATVGGAVVGGDRVLSLPECFQRVPDGQVRLGIPGSPDQQLAIQAYRAFVLTKAYARRRVQGLKRAVVGFRLHELLKLAAALLITVQLDEHEGVLLARGTIVGCALEYRGEQHLRIEVDPVRDADAGQQAHSLDVIAVLEEIRAHQRLGRFQLAICKQPGRNDDLLWQGAQRRHLAGCGGSVVRLALHAVQALEHPPRPRERMIEVHGLEERFDRWRRLPQRDVTAAALLVQTTEARMMLLERDECREGLGNLP